MMISNIAFSIILPVRNGENYISTAIESVLAQTYPYFSLIILENYSTDNTLAIAESYAAVDDRVSIVPTQTSLSITENWARILELELTYSYLVTLCHDDYFYPDFLQQVATAIAEYPTASLYTARFDFVDYAGQFLHHSQESPLYESAEQFLIHAHKLERGMVATGFVVRTVDFIEIGGLPPFAGLLYADEYAWYRLSIPGGKICLSDSLFACRRHETNAGHTASLKIWYMAIRQYLETLDPGLFEEHENYLFVREHLQTAYSGLYHRKLFYLGRTGTFEDWVEYDADKATILADAQNHDLFVVYDRVSWLYEKIGRIKWRILRLPLIYIILITRSTRQYLRKWNFLR